MLPMVAVRFPDRAEEGYGLLNYFAGASQYQLRVFDDWEAQVKGPSSTSIAYKNEASCASSKTYYFSVKAIETPPTSGYRLHVQVM